LFGVNGEDRQRNRTMANSWCIMKTEFQNRVGSTEPKSNYDEFLFLIEGKRHIYDRGELLLIHRRDILNY